MARFPLRHGAKADQPHRGFVTPLEYAARRDNLSMARLLLEAGADPTPRDQIGHTPLDIALSIQRRPATPRTAETIEILRRAVTESSRQR